jgi:hypothetical protein
MACRLSWSCGFQRPSKVACSAPSCPGDLLAWGKGTELLWESGLSPAMVTIRYCVRKRLTRGARTEWAMGHHSGGSSITIFIELQASYSSLTEIEAFIHNRFRQHHQKFSIKFLRKLLQFLNELSRKNYLL